MFICKLSGFELITVKIANIDNLTFGDVALRRGDALPGEYE